MLSFWNIIVILCVVFAMHCNKILTSLRLENFQLNTISFISSLLRTNRMCSWSKLNSVFVFPLEIRHVALNFAISFTISISSLVISNLFIIVSISKFFVFVYNCLKQLNLEKLKQYNFNKIKLFKKTVKFSEK